MRSALLQDMGSRGQSCVVSRLERPDGSESDRDCEQSLGRYRVFISVSIASFLVEVGV